MLRPAILHFGLTAAFGTVAGCAAPLEVPGALAERTRFLGVMWVEQQELPVQPSIGDGEGDSAAVDDAVRESEIGAAFASYRGLEARDVFGLLGSDPAFSPCQHMDGSADPVAADAFVDLHESGVVTVAVHDDEVALHPRTFPDLAGVVSGAFYAEDTALTRPEAEVDAYRLSTPFASVDITAPSGFGQLRLQRASEDTARLANLPGDHVASLRMPLGTDAVLAWDAGDPADSVEVVLSVGAERVRCLVPDEGRVDFPAEVTAGLPASDAQLTLRRIRREQGETASMPWVDSGADGQLWFSAVVRRTVPVHLLP